MTSQAFARMPGAERAAGRDTVPISTARLWTSRVLSGVAILFLLMDGGMKIWKVPGVMKATVQFGYPEATIVGIGAVLLLCSLLYVIPRTAVLGAILLTGYLGGAVASNVRISTPLFNVIFPMVFAVLIWAPLVLRSRQVEAILFKKGER